MHNLTKEQQAVVYHPLGRHARVLAVAGSGKTTTMVHRVKHLVMDLGVPPSKICILMFNKLARFQFKEKLDALQIPAHLQPQVNTFHSFSFHILGQLIAKGLLPGTTQIWVGDKEEMARRTVHAAIQALEQRNGMASDDSGLDVDEVMEAISLWKGSLIPPDRAGYRGNPLIPLVYAEFEELRLQRSALTFDDFVPMAIGALENETSLQDQWCRYEYVIVDEYQDVNYGQQRLIELVAGSGADIMVVGDDDQTIYEWRGARPNYILREFRSVFNNKPHSDYTLSHTFRFGPTVAQCAQNTISFNTNRIAKPLIAFNPSLPTNLRIITNSSEQATDVNKELVREIVSIVRQVKTEGKSIHDSIIVLARMFSQLSGIEAEFLTWKIPYRVVGRAPFFERREICVLLDYIRLASQLDMPVTTDSTKLLLSVANTPNRKISKKALQQMMERAEYRGMTMRSALSALTSSSESMLTRTQRTELADFVTFVERWNERLFEETDLLAGELLHSIVETLNYLQHFDNYYGNGEASEDRKRAVVSFCQYADRLQMRPMDFIRHVESLDTTRGAPEEDQIIMTTIFRTKGLEYDYVVIPACEEGYMPCTFGTASPVFDTAGIVDEPEASAVIENERRLFYVAITRARKGVIIGTCEAPKQGSQRDSRAPLPSRFLHEIQLEPTVSVMRSLQEFANHPSRETANHMIQAALQHGHLKSIMANLVDKYLPALNQGQLAEALHARLTRIPPSEFVYPFPYDRPNIQTIASPPATSNESGWWDDLPF